MKLLNENNNGIGLHSEYFCEITTDLDILAKLDDGGEYHLYHYIVIYSGAIEGKCLPIRVHGGTVGGIWMDDNNIITKIDIDTNYVVKSYPSNINDMVKKYIGERLEW